MDEFKDVILVTSDPIWSKRVFDIPVLNRDDVISFSSLVSNSKGEEPGIYLACEQTGLKLEANYVRPILFWGENQSIGAICGMIICAILIIPTLYFISSKIIAAIVVFVLGCCCLFPGTLFLKLLRKIREASR